MMLKKINRTTRRQGKNLPTEKQKKNELRVLSLYLHINLHMPVNSGKEN